MINFLRRFIGIQSATAIIINHKNKILLTKRSPLITEGNKWCLPGGHSKKGETAEQSAKRELFEETGLNIKNAKLLFVHEEFIKRLNLHANVFVFLSDFSGKLKTNWEVSECRWFSRQEINKMNLAFTHKIVMDKYFKGVKK
ncbi:NUDIX hydrolase [Candidatus Pacearchaeota archaeon]|nr:NUDIX hydrolase [Candidatus Pacearchaeota archaeon]